MVTSLTHRLETRYESIAARDGLKAAKTERI